jgi:hypothetical protein
MHRVGQQRHRTGKQPHSNLRGDQKGIEPDPDRERRVMSRRPMMMVAVPMPISVPMSVIMPMSVLMPVVMNLGVPMFMCMIVPVG